MLKAAAQKIEKKYKFGIHALFYAAILYSHIEGYFTFPDTFYYIIIVPITAASVILVHYPNITIKNFVMAALLPVVLAYGGTLSLLLFPNVSLIFKLTAVAVFAFLDYVVLLIDNIFLVVEGREELIPLYRVAVTWSLIIQIVVLIPLVSSVYKFNINSYYQALAVGVISFLYTIYQIWVSRYDKDAKDTGVVERVFLSLIVFFVVTASVAGVSFIPSEPFLKALFTATVAMFGLSYISAYLKNEINKKFIFQYTTIILFFLVLMLIFRP